MSQRMVNLETVSAYLHLHIGSKVEAEANNT